MIDGFGHTDLKGGFVFKVKSIQILILAQLLIGPVTLQELFPSHRLRVSSSVLLDVREDPYFSDKCYGRNAMHRI